MQDSRKRLPTLQRKLSPFLNYTSDQWPDENKLVVENGIRNELSRILYAGMKSLFEDHYVTLPDEKYDIFESMVAKLDDMENKLNEQIEQCCLSSQMSGYKRDQYLLMYLGIFPKLQKIS